MPDSAPVITIDGPSASGKGTISAQIAEKLGWNMLDSGALYRLVAYALLKANGDVSDTGAVQALASQLDVEFVAQGAGAGTRILLEKEDVTDAIRTEAVGNMASQVAVIPEVRQALLERQRQFQQSPGLVADGRDMGTVVFPAAGLKIFLTASVEERARRRYKQLKDKGMDVSLRHLSRDMEERDRRDSERSVAPLRAAEDARVLDSTDLAIPEVVDLVITWANEVFPQ